MCKIKKFMKVTSTQYKNQIFNTINFRVPK